MNGREASLEAGKSTRVRHRLKGMLGTETYSGDWVKASGNRRQLLDPRLYDRWELTGDTSTGRRGCDKPVRNATISSHIGGALLIITEEQESRLFIRQVSQADTDSDELVTHRTSQEDCCHQGHPREGPLEQRCRERFHRVGCANLGRRGYSAGQADRDV